VSLIWRGADVNLFYDPKDEERLCQVLKAYVEEWGSEYVSVSVPARWKGRAGCKTLGRVRLLFDTENAVAIKVECQCARLVYEVQLRIA